MVEQRFICPRCGNDRNVRAARRWWDYVINLHNLLAGFSSRRCAICMTRFWALPLWRTRPDVQFRENGIYLVWPDREEGPFESIARAEERLDWLDQQSQ